MLFISKQLLEDHSNNLCLLDSPMKRENKIFNTLTYANLLLTRWEIIKSSLNSQRLSLCTRNYCWFVPRLNDLVNSLHFLSINYSHVHCALFWETHDRIVCAQSKLSKLIRDCCSFEIIITRNERSNYINNIPIIFHVRHRASNREMFTVAWTWTTALSTLTICGQSKSILILKL